MKQAANETFTVPSTEHKLLLNKAECIFNMVPLMEGDNVGAVSKQERESWKMMETLSHM